MAVRTDLERLVVQLSADIRSYERALQRAQSQTERSASTIEGRFRKMTANINKSFGSIGGKVGLSSGLVGTAGAALAAREVQLLADAWTTAGNKIAAASEIAGRAARPLEEINDIATRTRTGITQTVDLYSKLLRATARVAKSEEEVARATEIVNKAFKAGGAATSEQVAGILQLSQALGSGILQGDELRSIRENAPLIAQAIADEFGTTIAGLKELGAAGQLEVGRVFKAILNAQPKIEAAFARTNATIGDGITLVVNAMTQYVGQTDAGLGASQRLVAGLKGLADNFDVVADSVLNVAGIIAGALLGRSIAGMLVKIPQATAAVFGLGAAMRVAGAAGGAGAALSTGVLGFSKVAGPVGVTIGVVAAAALLLSGNSESAAERTARLTEELKALGLIADDTTTSVNKVSGSLDNIAPEKVFKKLQDIEAELDRIRHGDQSLVGFLVEQFGDANNLDRIINQLKLIEHFSFTEQLFGTGPTDIDQKIAAQLINISTQFNALEIDAQTFLDKLNEISQTPVSPDLTKLISSLRTLAVLRGALIKAPDLVDQTGKATIFKQIQKDIDAIRIDKLKEIINLMLQEAKDLSPESPFGKVIGLAEGLQSGELEANKVVEKLKEISAQNINQPIHSFIELLLVAIAKMQILILKAKESTHGKIGPVQQFEGEPSAQGRLQRTFFDNFELEQAKTEAEIALQKMADTIKEASVEAGVTISDELARFRAQMQIELNKAQKIIPDPSVPGQLEKAFFDNRRLLAARTELEVAIDELAEMLVKQSIEAGAAISLALAKVKATAILDPPKFPQDPSVRGQLEQQFLDFSRIENAKSDFEKALDDLAKQIIADAEKWGFVMSEGMARVQARAKIFAKELEKAIPVDPSIPGRSEKKFFENQALEDAKTDLQRAIESVAEIIKKEALAAGVTLSDGTAKLRAMIRIDNENTKKAVDEFLKEQEELREERSREAFREGISASEEIKGSATGLRESATKQTESAQELIGSSTELDGSAANLNTAAAALAGAADVLGRTAGQISGSIVDTSIIGTDLLDLIRKAEGTATGRGFNETLGRGAFTGGNVDLINMTLREVLALQKQMLAHPANKFDSSAAGGFQIVSRTLEGLIKRMDLSLDQKFTPELQTRMAEVLAASRIAAGGGDMKEVIKQLRAEWQGLHKVSDAAIAAAVNANNSTGQVIAANNAQAASTQDVANANKTAARDIAASAAEQRAKVDQFTTAFEQAGIKVSKAAIDLANVLGVESAKKILQAAPGTPVSQVLPQQQIQQFPQILGPEVTAQQLIDMANARGGLTAEILRQNDAYNQLHASETAEIASLDIERQALTMTTFEAEKLRYEHEQLNKLRRDGVVITPQMAAGISILATKFAQEKVAIEGIAEAQRKAAETAREMAEAQKRAAEESKQMAQAFESAFAGAVKGFISDLIHGKSATEALSNALQRLADQLLDIVLNQMFKNLFSGALGGGAAGGGIFGGLFHKGTKSAGLGGLGRRVHPAIFAGAPRYHRGGIAGLRPGELPAILKRGEPVGPEAVNAAARRMIQLGAEKFAPSQQSAPVVNLTNKIVNAFDSGGFLSEALATPMGEKAILNFVKSRPAAFRSAIQG